MTQDAEIEWPGFQTTASHSRAPTQMPTKTWFGGVLEGMRDAGGTMCMRNRYYDPATGQFTQTDPIGIAGGLNTYGFANGDPVTYSDPYGLCPGIPGTNQFDLSDCPEAYFEALGTVADATLGSTAAAQSAGHWEAAPVNCACAGMAACGAGGAALGGKAGAAVGTGVGGGSATGLALSSMALWTWRPLVKGAAAIVCLITTFVVSPGRTT